MINLTKRGKVYHANATVGGVRLRGSLGTQEPKVARKLALQIELALAEGPKGETWKALKNAIPEATYQTFSSGEVAEPLTTKSIWFHYGNKLDRRASLGEISESTRDRYFGAGFNFFDWIDHGTGVRLMDDITPTMIEEYRAYRLAQTLQRKQSRGGQGLDVGVVVLKQIFDLAIEMGYSKPNPVKSISRTKVSPSKFPEPFTFGELQQLSNMADTQEFWWLVFLLLRWTGMRGSDVVRLKWTDFEFDGGVLRLHTQKRGKEVVIPLQSSLKAELLRRYYVLPMDTDYNQPILKGLTRPRLYTLVQKLGELAGVKNCRPHRFRSTLATELLAKGTSIHDVALLLGDSVSVIEKHYCGHKGASVERVRGIMNTEVEK